MIDEKKAVPPQNSYLYVPLNEIDHSKKFVIVKHFRSHASEFRDCIVGTYSSIEEAHRNVFSIIENIQQEDQSIGFKAINNSFLSRDYSFDVYAADDVIGFYGQEGYFTIKRRSARNVFIRLLQWVPVTEVPMVFRCCSKILQVETDKQIINLLSRLAICTGCDLTPVEIAGQYAYQQAKLKQLGFDELVLLDVLEYLVFLGAKFDWFAALEHAYLLSDGSFYAYCNSKELQYE